MAVCLLGLGSNQGDREAHLVGALAEIGKLSQTRVVARSGLRESLPVGGSGHLQPFLNGGCLIETSLAPLALWERLSAIETQLGRVRKGAWGPRPIDLDLLLYDDQVLWGSPLLIPHPWMLVRTFVMEPAAELAPEMRHPLANATLADLYDHLQHAPPRACVLSATRMEPPPGLDWPVSPLEFRLGEDDWRQTPAAIEQTPSPGVLWGNCSVEPAATALPILSLQAVSPAVRLFVGLLEVPLLDTGWREGGPTTIDETIAHSLAACGKPFVLMEKEHRLDRLAAACHALETAS